MKKQNSSNFFENFLKKEEIFTNKKILQISYLPDTIEHRGEQIEKIQNILAPVMKLERPSNLFIYGKTGTGKTVSIKHITNQLKEAAEKADKPITVIYVNCKLKRVADTEYRIIAQLGREMGKKIPDTGLPTDGVYRIFVDAVDKKEKFLLIVLDEIDQLVNKTGDDILYNLISINEELKNSQISIVGISNNSRFIDNIDPRVKSRLSEEDILFPPYNALQLQDILRKRSNKAFKKNVLKQGVVEKCAAYSAKEHGDARRALDLLRVAGEVAEREGSKSVNIKHIDEAEEKIEKDRVFDIITTQPKQSQATLYSMLLINSKNNEVILTGQIYDTYKNLCSQINLKPLTQRRIGDLIAEMDMMGIINARVISKGRYGRTREITLSTPETTNKKIKQILEEGLDIS
ncbi:cell division control protein Cdc6 [Candidatus Woesearchaeota archaeon B3_Woes]|nr:MAG: cell division control protein Cdc6 [Candidatus Woesearchaeota archaeon B3_Woes]